MLNLTPTQRKILTLILEGKRPKAIQIQLSISIPAYGQTLHRARKKNGLQTTQQLVGVFGGETGKFVGETGNCPACGQVSHDGACYGPHAQAHRASKGNLS